MWNFKLEFWVLSHVEYQFYCWLKHFWNHPRDFERKTKKKNIFFSNWNSFESDINSIISQGRYLGNAVLIFLFIQQKLSTFASNAFNEAFNNMKFVIEFQSNKKKNGELLVSWVYSNHQRSSDDKTQANSFLILHTFPNGCAQPIQFIIFIELIKIMKQQQKQNNKWWFM